MARPKKTAEDVIDAAKLESGAGNLSPEDLAAIRGQLPGDVPMGATLLGEPMTATETMLREREDMAIDIPAPPQATPEEVSLGARMATLEHEMGKLKAAMEAWAATMNAQLTEQPRHVDSAIPVRPASKAEEAAYCRVNFERLQARQPQFGGIQEWRNAGSPGLAA